MCVNDTDFLSFIEHNHNFEEKLFINTFLKELENQLDEKNRKIAFLCFKHNLKNAEIAEITGLSIHAVKKRIRKIRKIALSIREKYA